MIEDRERAVAYITGRITRKSAAGLIRDEESRAFALMSGNVSEDFVHVYDFQSHGFISGMGSSGRLTLFHSRDNATVDLTATEPGRFAGYDHDCGQSFTVTVDGKSVTVTGMIAGRSRKYTV